MALNLLEVRTVNRFIQNHKTPVTVAQLFLDEETTKVMPESVFFLSLSARVLI
jgi:hypothetical protein